VVRDGGAGGEVRAVNLRAGEMHIVQVWGVIEGLPGEWRVGALVKGQ